MEEQINAASARQKQAEILLRWARVEDALPKMYTVLVLDKLRQYGETSITKRQINDCKNDAITTHPIVIQAFEEIAKSYYPERIRTDKQARKFLSKWERRPGKKSRAALLASA